MAYGKVHRYFLRVISSQGVLTLSDVNKIFEKYSDDGPMQLQVVVKEINDEIRPYQQEIKITNDELTNEEVVVFISLGYDDTTKSQNAFSPIDLQYFRVLIEQIMTTETRQITEMNAINLLRTVKSVNYIQNAQKLLNTWCKMRYLDKEEHNYVLGIRGIHEFASYLRENLSHAIEECCLCRQIVFRGYNCPGCALAIHTRCLNRYLENVKKWPCCKIDFNSEQLERLNDESIQTQQPFATQESVEYNTIVEPILNQELNEDAEMLPESSQAASQKTSKKRKRMLS